MFESIWTMLNSFNFFGVGIIVLILGIIIATAIGSTKNKFQLGLYGIFFLIFFSVLIIKNEEKLNVIAILVSMLVLLIYLWRKQERNKGEQNVPTN